MKQERIKPRLNVGVEFLAVRRLARIGNLSMAAVLLYEALLWENNLQFWLEYFTTTDCSLSDNTRIPRTKLAPIKRELAAAGLLRMYSGKRNGIVYQLFSADAVLQELQRRAKENEAFFFLDDGVSNLDFPILFGQHQQQSEVTTTEEENRHQPEETTALPLPKVQAEKIEPPRENSGSSAKEKPRGYRPGTTARGKYLNVFLSDEELKKFSSLYPSFSSHLLDHFSKALKEKGYHYPNHFEALLLWAKDYKPTAFSAYQSRQYTEEDIEEIKRREFEINKRMVSQK